MNRKIASQRMRPIRRSGYSAPYLSTILNSYLLTLNCMSFPLTEILESSESKYITNYRQELYMKVLLINGSPHKEGCVFTALCEVAGQLNKQGIETSIVHIGNKPIHGCVACFACAETGFCVFKDDPVNECIDLMNHADGFVIGSPVYYAAPNGALCSFLDRMFFLKAAKYALKPAAAIVNCRRGGASAAFDRLNKYFSISSMPIVTSQYWNSTHGMTPEEVKQDLEGLQTMRTLGNNMAWLLKCIEIAKDTVPYPEKEPRQGTNFIR